jgi:hypothetical protein
MQKKKTKASQCDVYWKGKIPNKWCNKTNTLGNAHTWNLVTKINNEKWKFKLGMTNIVMKKEIHP